MDNYIKLLTEDVKKTTAPALTGSLSIMQKKYLKNYKSGLMSAKSLKMVSMIGYSSSPNLDPMKYEITLTPSRL